VADYKDETKKALQDIDKRIGQSDKQYRERSYQARLGMATSDTERKRITDQKLQSDARRKKLKEESKKRKEENTKRLQKMYGKDYYNSKNKSRMSQPRIGTNPDAFDIKGGAGPRGKFLKRI
jgi:hypothetical protein